MYLGNGFEFHAQLLVPTSHMQQVQPRQRVFWSSNLLIILWLTQKTVSGKYSLAKGCLEILSAERTKAVEEFVKNLLMLMEITDLELRNKSWEIALSSAAAVGNIETAKALVESLKAKVNETKAVG